MCQDGDRHEGTKPTIIENGARTQEHAKSVLNISNEGRISRIIDNVLLNIRAQSILVPIRPVAAVKLVFPITLRVFVQLTRTQEIHIGLFPPGKFKGSKRLVLTKQGGVSRERIEQEAHSTSVIVLALVPTKFKHNFSFALFSSTVGERTNTTWSAIKTSFTIFSLIAKIRQKAHGWLAPF